MPYRDDTDPLVNRCSALEQRLADLTQRTQDLASLERARDGVAAELREARKQLEDARRRRALPLLSQVTVASPCSARWDDMLGDERARFCQECHKHVYNLSAMTQAEAERLLQEKEGRLCVRFYRRADGTVLTADCPVGQRRRRVRRVVMAVGAGLFAGMGAYTAMYATIGRPAMMGAIAPPEARMGQMVSPVEQGEPAPVGPVQPGAPSVHAPPAARGGR